MGAYMFPIGLFTFGIFALVMTASFPDAPSSGYFIGLVSAGIGGFMLYRQHRLAINFIRYRR